MIVLFDLDGTLVDTAGDLITATQQLCLENNHWIDDVALIQNHISCGLQKILEVAFGNKIHNISEQALAKLKNRFKELYKNTNFSQSEFFPGTLELLTTLQYHNFKMGIVTNKTSEFVNLIGSKLNFHRFFNCIITSDQVVKPKPSPEGVLLALQQLQALPTAAVFIGDAQQDIIAGNLANVTTIAALFGYISKEIDPRLWQADYLVNSTNELWPLIQKIFHLPGA